MDQRSGVERRRRGRPPFPSWEMRRRGMPERRHRPAAYMTDGDVRRWWEKVKGLPAPRLAVEL